MPRGKEIIRHRWHHECSPIQPTTLKWERTATNDAALRRAAEWTTRTCHMTRGRVTRIAQRIKLYHATNDARHEASLNGAVQSSDERSLTSKLNISRRAGDSQVARPPSEKPGPTGNRSRRGGASSPGTLNKNGGSSRKPSKRSTKPQAGDETRQTDVAHRSVIHK